MEYKAVIEIPKGSDRRIHMAYDKSGFIDLGAIIEKIPINNGVMPVHYGYIDGVMNKEEGDEVDVIVFSNLEYKTGDSLPIEIIGLITREDGDHKVIARDMSVEDDVFDKLKEGDKTLILNYFGYNSPIVSLGGKEEGLGYLEGML